MARFKFVLIPLTLLLSFGWVLAQSNTCPVLVQSALQEAQTACSGLVRNQACYGHVLLKATPNNQVKQFQFAKAGDMADVTAIRSLKLSPFDMTNDQWGLAMMQLQADIPNSLQQNVTLLLFGDVAITNQVEASPNTSDATLLVNANVRVAPSLTAPLLTGLSKGKTVTLDGRSPDGQWLRVRVPQVEQVVGWVRSDLTNPAQDITKLDVIDPADIKPRLQPMQAFYLTTGSDDQPACNEIPRSGLLVQTPEGVGKISLWINEVKVRVGSTIFFQAQPGQEMVIAAVEGSAIVTAQGITSEAMAGTQVRVKLNADLSPAGPPSDPEPYDMVQLATLPVQNLHRRVQIHKPLTPKEIREHVDKLPKDKDKEKDKGREGQSGDKDKDKDKDKGGQGGGNAGGNSGGQGNSGGGGRK
jgi:uncharacterized membrane protein YgcG